MKITLNGGKAGNGDSACYFENKACFKKRGLKKRTVLHEVFHHLVYCYELEMLERNEEIEANGYTREFLKR